MSPRLASLLLAGALLAGCDCGGCDTRCDGECVDFTNDPANCGACGMSCGSGACVAGTCAGTCGAGLAACAGECVDLERDPSHCGACGVVCTGACEAAVCAEDDAGPGNDAGASCLPGQMLCRLGCVSPYHEDHCGSTEARGCLEMPCGSNDGCNGVSCEVTTSALDRTIQPDALFGGALIGLFNFVCPSSLTPEVATVACRRWGMSSGEVIPGDWAYPATTPYLVTCTGTEASLEDCTNTETTRGAACLEPAQLVRCQQ